MCWKKVEKAEVRGAGASPLLRDEVPHSCVHAHVLGKKAKRKT